MHNKEGIKARPNVPLLLLLLFAAIMLLLLYLSFSVICLFAHYLFIVTVIVVCDFKIAERYVKIIVEQHLLLLRPQNARTFNARVDVS